MHLIFDMELPCDHFCESTGATPLPPIVFIVDPPNYSQTQSPGAGGATVRCAVVLLLLVFYTAHYPIPNNALCASGCNHSKRLIRPPIRLITSPIRLIRPLIRLIILLIRPPFRLIRPPIKLVRLPIRRISPLI